MAFVASDELFAIDSVAEFNDVEAAITRYLP